VNRILAPDVEGDRFITLLLARLDPRTRSLVYTSAGHQTGYVFDATGAIKAALKSTSVPLGIFLEAEFPTGDEVRLQTGDLVLFLTDGVVEARTPDGMVFGTQRVEELIRFYRTASARQIVENIYHAVRAFSHNLPQYDDITATVIKVGPVAKREEDL
jgi:sigma-B regulation protein RsbU (phosphoserine phosphatase)